MLVYWCMGHGTRMPRMLCRVLTLLLCCVAVRRVVLVGASFHPRPMRSFISAPYLKTLIARKTTMA